MGGQMKSAVIDGFKRWKDYSGRNTRPQFWWFYLFTVISPVILSAISLVGMLVISILNLDSLATLIYIFSFLYLLIIPSFIASAVRRMHDVGKSGWFILVPVYNLFLFVQPSIEKGRIPNWILAEKVSLGFVAILIVGAIVGLFTGDSDSLTGLVLWSIIYLLIRRKNKSIKKAEEQ
jgi:uncharacterized membrane protein YhaH (DUF805 family)